MSAGTLGDDEFALLAIYAVRYALGRDTGAPHETARVARMLKGRERGIIVRDVSKWLGETWHEHPQRDLWERLVADLTGGVAL